MSSSNGHAAVTLSPLGVAASRIRPETGPQPQDGPTNKAGRGRARMHERGDLARADSPLVKFARVWQ